MPSTTYSHMAGSSTSNMLIHIGYHKTGTTFLQKNFFSLKDIGFDSHDYFFREKIKELLVLPGPFDYSLSRAKDYFYPIIDRSIENGFIPVISHERLSGALHCGGYDKVILAHRLAELFPEAKILMCIREQTSIIYSSWAQFIIKGGTQGLREYISPPRQVAFPCFKLEHFDYHKMMQLYSSLFRREQILVLPYEDLVKDNNHFLSQILSFAQTKKRVIKADNATLNASANSIELSIRRLLNPFISRSEHNNYSPLYIRQLSEAANIIMKATMPKLSNKKAETKKRLDYLAQIRSLAGSYYWKSNKLLVDAGIINSQHGYSIEEY